MDPLWNHILVAGFDDADAPFLASADLLGTTFQAPSIATGFGGHLAAPLLRRLVPDEESVKGLDRERAVEAMKECMKVLFYRDARSLDKYSIAVITKEGGVDLKEDEQLERMSWAFGEFHSTSKLGGGSLMDNSREYQRVWNAGQLVMVEGLR